MQGKKLTSHSVIITCTFSEIATTLATILTYLNVNGYVRIIALQTSDTTFTISGDKDEPAEIIAIG